MLAFNGGDGGFEDLAGNNLDGQPAPFPIPPNVSGDGVPDGECWFRFCVDTPGALPLGPVPAAGATFPIESAVAPAGDAESYTLDLAAGRTVAVDVTPFIDGVRYGITLAIELRDPAGNLLASAAAPEMYRNVSLPPFAAPSAGRYTVTLRGAPGEWGMFRGSIVVGPAPQP